MKTRNRFLSLAISMPVIFVLMLTANHATVKANIGCNDATIAGTYGFALTGLVSPSFKGQPQQIGEFIPLAAAGTFSFDGNGTASRSFTASFGGQISTSHDSGPYKVISGCKGSATFPDGTWRMVVIDHGREIKVINATPGILVDGVLTQQ
jgi:hypothetical protein